MIQDTLFDPHALADMWERAPEVEPAPIVPTRPVVYCLTCGNVTLGRIFCNAGCKRALEKKANAWQAKISKTRIEGEQGLF